MSVMNETKFKIWEEIFEFRTHQGDMQASYSCRN